MNDKIAVIGAGTMGAGIAQIAAAAGYNVVVIDSRDEGLSAGRTIVEAGLSLLVERARINAGDRRVTLNRISWSTRMEDCVGACLAIEAIVEKLEVKRDVFARLATIMGDDALLATNTSSLSIGAIARELTNPSRFLGLHFFNPVPAMRLVEVIGGPHTDADAIEAACQLMTEWKKDPVIVRDVPGFIVNRVARPYYAEGFCALAEGMEPATVDAALTMAGGFRMGPLALGDLIGHDVNYTVAVSVHQAYEGRTRFRPQSAQQALVESGRLGRKTGSGVYDHGAPLPAVPKIEVSSAPGAIAISGHVPRLMPLVALLQDKGVPFSTDASLPADTVKIGETLAAMGDGRRLASLPHLHVLIDAPRDFGTASAWPITSGAPRHAAAVAALASLCGADAIELPDRPGQIVLRTLAQLANAAADAVADKVASRQDIDLGMRLGANHPEGPLEWAERFGMAGLRTVLDNIATETGDSLYAPSDWLKST